jgi:hypothetical protein
MKTNAYISCHALAALALLGPLSVTCADGPGAAHQYGWLQQLEGDWVLAPAQEGEAAKHPVIAPLVGSGRVALSYRLVGSKTTLQENIFPGTPREMATMYHCIDKDCSQVVADHYCSLKNQPVLRAEPGPEAGRLVFRCDPSVPVCSSPDAHLDTLTIELPRGGEGPLRTTFALQKDGKPGESLLFLFERKR